MASRRKRTGSSSKASKKKGKALQRLGVDSATPAIRGTVKLNLETQKHLDKEILRANGNKVTNLQKNLEGEEKVAVHRLKLKKKCSWTQTVKRLPEVLRRDFVVPQRQVQQPSQSRKEGAAAAKGLGGLGSGRKRVVDTSLPKHDFVQPLFKKAKQQASQRELVVTIGMLSAKLREKFSHLCTET